MKPTAPAQPKRSAAMQELLSEQWMIRRLGQHGANIDIGLTTLDIRRERMREAIQQVGPQVIVGRTGEGKSMSYAEAYEKLWKVLFEIAEDVV